MNIRTPVPFPGLDPMYPTEITPISELYTAGRNGTLIVFVLDESGSMNSCVSDTIGGFNGLISKQREGTDQCHVTLNKFNSGPKTTVFSNVDIRDPRVQLNHSNYTPGGGTALLDALGDTIMQVNGILQGIVTANRPNVLIVVMTDGEENASFRFSSTNVKNLVQAARAADWTFTFLGANIDSFSIGNTLGFHSGSVLNYSTSNMAQTMDAVAGAATHYRSMRSMGLSNDQIEAKGLYSSVDTTKIGG